MLFYLACLFITVLFAYRDKRDQTQVLPSYEIYSFELYNNDNKYAYGTEHAQEYGYIDCQCQAKWRIQFNQSWILLDLFLLYLFYYRHTKHNIQQT